MTKITTIGLDLAKKVLQVHGVDVEGTVIVARQLRRKEVLAFFANLAPCVVGMEACAVLSDLRAACRERPQRIGSRARFERSREPPWTARIATRRRPTSGRGERFMASGVSGAGSAGGGSTSGPARC